jgi:polyprenyl-phospho-N-acetylgalactosaminyl synthase
MRVAAVIPCLNVAHRVGDVVSSLLPYVSVAIAIDDGSTDNTAEVAAAAGATVLRHRVNRGYGAAVTTGFAWADKHGYDAVVMFDGDGQFVADEIPRVLAPIEAGTADVVFGSRFLPGATTKAVPALKRWMILRPARLLERILTGLNLTDVHNGFRAFTVASLRRIEIDHDRYAFQTQLDRAVAKLGLRYVEVPVTVRYFEYGQGMAAGLRILGDLLLARVSR